MDFEKIEKAYDLLLENCQLIENDIKTTIYDALIEQNSFYLGAEGGSDVVRENNKKLAQLHLSKEEWRRAFQYFFIKAAQLESLQANHQFTPDSIGFILLFLMEELTLSQKKLDVLEIGSGTGNLAQTILNNSSKTIDYLGIEIDDLLIDLSASIAEIIDNPIQFLQEDAIRPQILKESDIILSDLPVGYYPNDEIAKRYQVASTESHTFAHHLLMEQTLKYLKKDGFALLLAPNDLLTSSQAPLLKKWLQNAASIVGVIALPENTFGNKAMMKSIFILQKQNQDMIETFIYSLSDLQNRENMLDFVEKFIEWKKDNMQFDKNMIE